MALANVALTDTFDTWRIRTNQLCSLYDQTNNSVTTATTLSGFSYTQANLAFTQANNAYAFANVVSGNARAAFIQANAAYTRANTKLTAVEGHAGRITATANGTYSYIVDLATTGPGAGSYTSGISAISIDAYGRITAITGSANYQTALGFTPVQQGGGTGQSGNKLYMGWTSSAKLAVQVDATNFGTTWPMDISGLSAKASTLAMGGGTGSAMTFNWSGQTGQPIWLWGSNDGTNHYVWNPSNFSVNYANYSGYFDNGYVYLTGNQINSYKATAAHDLDIAINYVGFNNTTTYRRNFTVYNGQNLPIGKFQASDTTFYCWGNVVAYQGSDRNLKTNIVPISNALEKVSQINGVEFDWTDDYLSNCIDDPYFTRKHDVGVIAQEVEKVLPEVVSTRQDGIKAVKYDRLVALLIEAIKELKQEVETLKSKQ